MRSVLNVIRIIFNVFLSWPANQCRSLCTLQENLYIRRLMVELRPRHGPHSPDPTHRWQHWHIEWSDIRVRHQDTSRRVARLMSCIHHQFICHRRWHKTTCQLFCHFRVPLTRLAKTWLSFDALKTAAMYLKSVSEIKMETVSGTPRYEWVSQSVSHHASCHAPVIVLTVGESCLESRQLEAETFE